VLFLEEKKDKLKKKKKTSRKWESA
jgi:hypothetical protein